MRAQGAPAVGVMGLSLGGYQTALLAGLDADLACAIAGIPLTDIARAVWRHGPLLHTTHAEHHGIVRDALRRGAARGVAARARAPGALERRWIFARVADQLVPPDQVRDLWQHWGRRKIAWYQGAHLTFRLHPNVAKLVLTALVDSGLST